MMFICFVLIVIPSFTSAFGEEVRVGILLKNEDTTAKKIIDYGFYKSLSNDRNVVLFTEKITEADAFHYHHAMCELLKKGVGVLLTPIDSAYFPTLTEYSNEYNISIVAPSFRESPDDPKAPDLQTRFAVAIQPSTLRPMLDFIRYAGWGDLVYIYDDEEGPEKLQMFYHIGYRSLKFKLLGISRVQTASEANEFLRSVARLGKHRTYRVILDTSASLAQDILQLHVHDTAVGKKNYHFLLSSLTLKKFWTLHEFGALKIRGFLALPWNYQASVNENEEWMKLTGHPPSNMKANLNVSDYYYHDSVVYLSQAIRDIRRMDKHVERRHDTQLPFRLLSDCFKGQTDGRIAEILDLVRARNGLTGEIKCTTTKARRHSINLTLVESHSHHGYQNLGYWTDIGQYGGIRLTRDLRNNEPESLPQIYDDKFLRITTLISPPYMMFKKAEDGSMLTGNNRFEGYCKDIVDILCAMVQMKCELNLVEDGTYGKFDNAKQRWSGMIGEIISGRADIAVSDLIITGNRQRVVDFSEPIDAYSFSVILKHPGFVHTSSSMFFILNAFSANVWICIILSAIIFSILFHGITKFTGAPDSIEAASGIWGRKNGIIINTWFNLGSSMLQSTGVFPRSISSRILTGAWWFSTLVFTSLLIASITAQLRVQDSGGEKSPELLQLKAMSVESILLESITNGWPKVGTVTNSSLTLFIKKSTLPLYQRFSQYIVENPEVLVSSFQEGVNRVRESKGGYILMAQSTGSDYVSRQKPCDLVVVEDNNVFGAYGVAVSPILDNSLKHNISRALGQMQRDGMLGHLHRKWWTDSSTCKGAVVSETKLGTLHSLSGFLCLVLAGFVVLLIIFSIQFSRRVQDKESRMQQLTFEDMNLDNQLPTPPPELLNQPPPIALATRL